MKISILRDILNETLALHGDLEILLSYERAVMEEGVYCKEETEGISDVRLVQDWPLPGKSLLHVEHEKNYNIVLFYANHDDLDSANK